MRLYDNAPQNYHDECASYFPRWYREVREMDAIWQVNGAMLDQARKDILQVLDNAGIVGCDYDTVHKLEEWLDIRFSSPRTDEARKAYLLAQIAGLGHCSRTKIQSIIRQYTGAESTVTFEKIDDAGNYGLIVEFDRGNMTSFYLDDVNEAVRRIMPCHIQYGFINYAQSEGAANLSIGTAQIAGIVKVEATATMEEKEEEVS